MPKERWDWHWPPIERRYLYQLPELIAAPIGQPVFVCEGEKDVERLRSLGLIATTCLGGAGKWYQHTMNILRGAQSSFWWTLTLRNRSSLGNAMRSR